MPELSKPKVAKESPQEFYYSVELSDGSVQTFRFQPKSIEAVATFSPNSFPALDDLSATHGLEVLSSNDSVGTAVFRITDDTDLQNNESLDQLIEHEQFVQNSLPVMVDGDRNSRYFLPDELTIQMAPSTTEPEMQRLLEQFGLTVIQGFRTPGFFRVVLPRDGRLFATIRALNQLPIVKFAEPSEISLDDSQAYHPAASEFSQLWR